MIEYARDVAVKLEEEEIGHIDNLNEIIKVTADAKLKRTYRKKLTNEANDITEPPWVTDEIRNERKERRRLNRLRRNCTSEEERIQLWNQYLEQKTKVQTIVWREIYKHDEKTKDYIKANHKKCFENIERLREITIKKSKYIKYLI